MDVRLVADTDCNLLALTRQGRFRMDLLQLLSTVTIRVPPLRERPEDIRAIAAEYWIRNFSSGPIAHHCTQISHVKTTAPTITGSAKKALRIFCRPATNIWSCRSS